MPKISVVTICYNEPKLEKTCKSIVDQTCQDFEWVVVDGGSDEKTQKIWDRYKYRIDKFVSESDNGIYNACNKGIKLADGEYIIFMNAGDVFYNENVLKAVTALMETTGADVIYGDHEFSFEEKNKNKISHYPQILTPDFFITSNLCTQSVFIKKDIFNIYGNFNEKYKIAADYDKWIQFFKAGKIFKYIPIIISSYDMNGISGNSDFILGQERKDILMEYLTQEVKEYEQKIKENYSFFEKIFSVKNSTTGIYKIITIFGLHIKIKRNYK